ncbi:MAG TPA: NAD(P)H-dependent oxidoreductase subunit E [Bryobacteraceae bacterium]|nr:NAD(P)H-dependent oxidoreductase subunit E [Bryobacteraceae bacterium]
MEQRIEKIIRSYPPGRQPSALIPLVIYCQDEVGSITEELIQECADRLGLTRLQVDEVVGYYSMLHKRPMGRYHVQVCTNISCLLVGGEELMEHASRKLGLGHKEVSHDGLISLEEVECMGACSWAPAIQINYDFHHNVTPEMFDKLMDQLRKAPGTKVQ